MSELILAIDQGGQSTRAIVYDETGGQIADAAESVGTTHPGPGRYEQDPEALVRSVRDVLTRVVPSLPRNASLRAALGTQRSSIVCWDRVTGQALSPVISWRDRRNADWLRSLDLEESFVRRITGLRPSPHYGAAKLRWCLDHLPEVRRARAEDRLVFGPMASFLVFRLTRERSLLADPVNASRTLLMDIGSVRWSGRLLAAFGMSADLLPPIGRGDAGLGTLDLAGLSVPLVLCTGDQAAAVYAHGTPDPSVAVVNAGTGAFALQRADWPNPESRLLTSVIRDRGERLEFAMEGTVNGAATALDAEAAELGVRDWTEILDGEAGITASLPVFLNGHSGLGSPWWRDRFACAYEGDGTAEEKINAVLESIVFMLHVNLCAMRKRVPAQEGIRVSGGLSHLDRFCQRLADISQLPVERPARIEATARGLAWLSLDPEGDWRVPGSACFEPGGNPGLRDRFDRWQSAMERALGCDTV